MTAPIKFYYDLMSQPSRALYIFLKLSKIPADFNPIALRTGAHLTNEFRDNVNRFQKAPAIVDNGFQLSESIAIFRYLVNRNNVDDRWYPKNDLVRARIDEYFEWQHLNTRLYCAKHFWLRYMKPHGVKPIPKFPTSAKSVDDELNHILDMIENLWLKPGCFISGTDQLSFADVLAACEIEQTTISGFDPTEKRPNLSDWLKNVRLLTNPAYDEANAILAKLREKTNSKQ